MGAMRGRAVWRTALEAKWRMMKNTLRGAAQALALMMAGLAQAQHGAAPTPAQAPAIPTVPVTATVPASAAVSAPVSASAFAAALADDMVDNFRRNILLHETHAVGPARKRTAAGHYLFFQNRLLASQLTALLAADPAACAALLARIVQAPAWRDIDQLALGGMLTELTLQLPADAPCAGSAQAARERLHLIRTRYNAEVTAALGGPARRNGGAAIDTPGVSSRAGAGAGVARTASTPRAAWQSYLAFLHTHFAGQVLAPELDHTSAAPLDPGVAPLAQRGERDEWTDGGLPPRTVLLTFDDGPHPLYTPQILDILARYRIKAVFFQVGQNIGTLDASGVTLRLPQLSARIVAEGHAVANHTHTHALLTGLDELHLTSEIDRAEALLSAATTRQSGPPSQPVAPGQTNASGQSNASAQANPPGQLLPSIPSIPSIPAIHPGRAALFRPPYGARNNLVLAEVTARGLRSVLWNIDSRDWADPLSRSVARRVIDETVREGRGIILFHDVHLRAVEALPAVIEELQQRGFRFARFADGKLMVDD